MLKLILCVELLTIVLLNALADIKLPNFLAIFGYMNTIITLYTSVDPDLVASSEAS